MKSIQASLAALLIIFSCQNELLASVVGSLPGDFVVDQTGSATYAIPISVAPGTAGMQPDLSLSHSSGAGGGLAGSGWSIGGLSQISRGGTTYARDGVSDPVDFDENDQFYLDGQRLIWIGEDTDPSLGSFQEYRTEIESWSRVRAFGVNATNDIHDTDPSYFIVDTKAGQRLTYGKVSLSSQSRLTPDGTHTTAWLVGQVEDSAGNFMRFYYDQSAALGDNAVAISQIHYTGNGSLSPYASVQFEYENRTDWNTSYDRHFNAFSLKKRLKRIYVVEGVSTVSGPSDSRIWHYYELSYADPNANGQSNASLTGASLLHKVTLFSRDPVTGAMVEVPSTQFDYTEIGDPAFQVVEVGNGTQLGEWTWDDDDARFIPFDYDQDGLNDLLKFRREMADDKVMLDVLLWNGSSFSKELGPIQIGVDPIDIQANYGLQSYTIDTSDDDDNTWGLFNVIPGDFNGDGYLDLFLAQWLQVEFSSIGTKRYRYRAVYLGTPTGIDLSGPAWEQWLNNQSFISKEEVPVDSEFLAADIDGNGSIDLYHLGNIFSSTGYLWIEKWSSSDTFLKGDGGSLFDDNKLLSTPELAVELSRPDRKVRAMAGDVNGDGLADLVFDHADANGKTRFTIFRVIPSPNGELHLATEQGSGADPDMRRWSTLTTDHWWLGNGTTLADLNGDGLPEIVHRYFDLNDEWLAFKIYRLTGTSDPGDPFSESSFHTAAYDQSFHPTLPATCSFNLNFNSGGQNNTFWIADVNFDGYADLIRIFNVSSYVYCEDPAGPTSTWADYLKVHYGNGTSFTNDGPIRSEPEYWDTENGANQLFPFDFDGLGLPQFIRLRSAWSGQSHDAVATKYDPFGAESREELHPPDMLVSATNGFGAVTTIRYAAATNRTLVEGGSAANPNDYRRVYESTSGSRYPIIDLPLGPMRLVHELENDVGGNTPHSSSYVYGAGRSHLQGRGFLGFGAVTSWNDDTRIYQVDFIAQEYPLTGMKRQSYNFYLFPPGHADEGKSIMLSHAYNELTAGLDTGSESYGGNVQSFDGSMNLGSAFPVIPSSVERKWEYRDQQDAAGGDEWANLPPEYSEVDAETQWDGLAEPTALKFGNVTQTVVTFKDGSKTTTANTYYDQHGPNATHWRDHWYLGRLKTAQVTHERPGTGNIVRSSSFEYDSGTGLLFAETIEPNKAALKLRTEHHRNTYGQIEQTIVKGRYGADSNGVYSEKSVPTEKITDWDDTHRFAESVENAFGQTSSSTYDFLGRLETQTGPNGKTTSWFYDALSRQIKEVRFDGTETRTSYIPSASTTVAFPGGVTIPSGVPDMLALSSSYRVETEASRSNNPGVLIAPKVTVHYDRLGREIRSQTQSLSTSSTNGTTEDVVSDTFYDRYGRVAAKSEPYFVSTNAVARNYTFSAFDVLGRLSKTVTPDGTVTTYGYGGLYSSVTRGDFTETTLADAQGNTSMVWNSDRGFVVDGTTTQVADPSVKYTYDAVGNLTHTVPDGNTAAQVVVNYGDGGYFKDGMIDPDMGTWGYSHDALGRLRRQTDATSHLTTMTYNDLGQLIERVDGAESVPDRHISRWFFYATSAQVANHPNNGLVAVGSSGGWIGALFKEVAYQSDGSAVSSQNATYYDDLGRAFLNLQQLDGKYYYDHTRYDVNGRVVGKDYFWRPKGMVADYQSKPYAWHSYGLRYFYNSRGAMLRVEGSDFQTWWSAPKYDHYGRVSEYQNGNGLNTTTTWDSDDGSVESIRVKTGSTDIQHFEYNFDQFGNLVLREDKRSGFNLKEEFGYDSLHRLKSRIFNGGNSVDIASYDDEGRIVTRDDVSGTTSAPYKYEGAHRHAVTEAWNKSYFHDSVGRIIERRNASEQVELSVQWTAFGKPLEIKEIGNHRVGFSYGAQRQRLTRTDSEWENGAFAAKRKKIYVNGWLEQEETRVGQSWETDHTRLYISGPGGVIGVLNHDADAASAAGISRRWFHYDHLGSISTITDEVGGVVERFSYSPWGERRDANNWNLALAPSGVDHDVTDRGFTGHEMLDNLGLVHMNGRIYDPLVGAFLSPDPHIQSPGNLQNYNRYSYVLNNPLSFTDPSGYFLDKLFKGIGKFVKKYWRTIVTIAIVVVVSVATLGAATAAWGTVMGSALAGAAGGFVGGVVGTMLNGGSLSQALSAGLTGAAIGALSGAAAGKIGLMFEGKEGFMVEVQRAAAHGVSGGVASELRGGEFFAGFMAGSFSSAASHGLGLNDWDVYSGTAAASIVGGTASVLGGGKFENGAVTGAFQHLFNAVATEKRAQEERLRREAIMASIKKSSTGWNQYQQAGHPGIAFDSPDGAYYDPTENLIHLSSDLSGSLADSVRSVAHELGHAYLRAIGKYQPVDSLSLSSNIARGIKGEIFAIQTELAVYSEIGDAGLMSSRWFYSEVSVLNSTEQSNRLWSMLTGPNPVIKNGRTNSSYVDYYTEQLND